MLAALIFACARTPDGTICLAPGMSRAEAQRLSTITLNQFGDSGRDFDFVLAGDGIRFKHCVEYAISTDANGRIEDFNVHTANESWEALRREVNLAEKLLLARGWRYAPGSRTVASMKDIRTDSGALDAYRFVKGDLELTLTPSRLWREKKYWRSVTIARREPTS